MTQSSSDHQPLATAKCVKVLKSELQELMLDPTPGISAFPADEDNILFWKGTIDGPPDTGFEKLKYKLEINFHPNHPFVAPKVKFITSVWHPNVSLEDGRICVDTLHSKWSPCFTVKSLLISIQSLLSEPNNVSPMNCHAAWILHYDTIFTQHLNKVMIRKVYHGMPASKAKKYSEQTMKRFKRKKSEKEKSNSESNTQKPEKEESTSKSNSQTESNTPKGPDDNISN